VHLGGWIKGSARKRLQTNATIQGGKINQQYDERISLIHKEWRERIKTVERAFV
jgi:hypothetical protein